MVFSWILFDFFGFWLFMCKNFSKPVELFLEILCKRKRKSKGSYSDFEFIIRSGKSEDIGF